MKNTIITAIVMTGVIAPVFAGAALTAGLDCPTIPVCEQYVAIYTAIRDTYKALVASTLGNEAVAWLDAPTMPVVAAPVAATPVVDDTPTAIGWQNIGVSSNYYIEHPACGPMNENADPASYSYNPLCKGRVFGQPSVETR